MDKKDKKGDGKASGRYKPLGVTSDGAIKSEGIMIRPSTYHQPKSKKRILGGKKKGRRTIYKTGK